MAWVWSDDLVRRLTPSSESLPADARRWLEAPIALRVAEDADDKAIADLVGFSSASSTVESPERAMAEAVAPCRCDLGRGDRSGGGASGSGS